MRTYPLPQGDAWKIAQARARKLMPSAVIIINCTERDFQWPNPTVYVEPGKRYTWDWLIGLQAILVIDSITRIDTTLDDVFRADPLQIDVIDCERELGWMVLTPSPRPSTVRWPKSTVLDWLAEGVWHQGLNDIKDKAELVRRALARMPKVPEQEAIWI